MREVKTISLNEEQNKRYELLKENCELSNTSIFMAGVEELLKDK